MSSNLHAAAQTGTRPAEMVFLICSERSGSNLLRVMMGNHSGVIAPPPLHLARDVGAHFHANLGAGKDGAAWPMMRDLVEERIERYYGKESGQAVRVALEELKEFTFDALLEAVFQVLNPEGKMVFLKENNLHEHLFYLLQSFPEAKFVFQVRDPRDYVASAKARRRSLLGNKFGSLRRCLEIWREDQLGGLRVAAHLGGDRVHIQRYEDLIQDSRGVLKDLCRFLGLAFEEDMLAFHEQEEVRQFAQKGQWKNLKKPVMADNFGNYRRKLSRREIRTVETWLGPLMERFGYACDFPAGEKPSVFLSLWPWIIEPLEKYLNGERTPFYASGRRPYSDDVERVGTRLKLPSGVPSTGTGEAWQVIDSVIAAAKSFPEEPALTVGGTTWNYGELLVRAVTVAKAIETGRQPGEQSVAAVLADRSLVSYAGVLGILLAGRTYVPLNAGYPAERNAVMLERSAAPVVVCAAEAVDRLREDLAAAGHDAGKLRILCVGETESEGAGAEEAAAFHQSLAEDRRGNPYAYILFTSGSTGVPKGVRVSHANLRAYLDAVSGLVEAGPGDRCSQTFDLTFDLSVHDLFVTWSKGAHLIVPSREDLLRVGDYVVKQSITHWFSVPSLAFQMQRQGGLEPGAFPSVRWSLFCGEGLPVPLAQAWATAAPGSVVENWYGPTEATISCTRHRWKPVVDAAKNPPRGLVPIGAPFPGMQAVVVTPGAREAENGEPGELWLQGLQVVEGYLNDPERTAQSFVRMPGRDGVFYRTGDRVVRDEQDEVHYLDRLDNQIKIRGCRVELGEVEAALREAAGGRNALALAWPPGHVSPTSILAAVEGADDDAEAIRHQVRGSLAPYMVPAQVIGLERFPTNASGKADRGKVAELVKERMAGSGEEAGFPEGSALRKLWDAVRAVRPDVRSEQLTGARNLLEGGLDSLGFIELTVRMENDFGFELTQENVATLSLMPFHEMAWALEERSIMEEKREKAQGRTVRAAQFLARFPAVVGQRPEHLGIVLGSSGVFKGIDPNLFDATAAQHGVTVRSLNVGLPGISCEGLARMAEFVRDRCRDAGVTLRCAVVEIDLMHISATPPAGDIEVPEEWITRPNPLILQKEAGEFTWTADNAGDSATRENPDRKGSWARWETRRNRRIMETYAGLNPFSETSLKHWLRSVSALEAVTETMAAFVHPIQNGALERGDLRNHGRHHEEVMRILARESGIPVFGHDAFDLEAEDFLNINHVAPGAGREKLTRQMAEHVFGAARNGSSGGLDGAEAGRAHPRPDDLTLASDSLAD